MNWKNWQNCKEFFFAPYCSGQNRLNPICNWVLFQCVYFSLHFTSFSSLMSLCLVTMSTTLMLFCLFSTLLPSPTPQLSHQVAAEVEPVRHPAPSINICLKIEKLSVDGELIAHNYVKIATSPFIHIYYRATLDNI